MQQGDDDYVGEHYVMIGEDVQVNALMIVDKELVECVETSSYSYVKLPCYY